MTLFLVTRHRSHLSLRRPEYSRVWTRGLRSVRPGTALCNRGPFSVCFAETMSELETIPKNQPDRSVHYSVHSAGVSRRYLYLGRSRRILTVIMLWHSCCGPVALWPFLSRERDLVPLCGCATLSCSGRLRLSWRERYWVKGWGWWLDATGRTGYESEELLAIRTPVSLDDWSPCMYPAFSSGNFSNRSLEHKIVNPRYLRLLGLVYKQESNRLTLTCTCNHETILNGVFSRTPKNSARYPKLLEPFTNQPPIYHSNAAPIIYVTSVPPPKGGRSL